MSAPQYRKVAAFALAAGLGLSLAACSTKNDNKGAADGKVTITVDCQPVGAQAELLRDWNADVVAFQKLHSNITIKSVSVGAQCDNPPDFTARLQGGTVTDVFYGYMTDLQQVIDSGQAMDVTQYVNKDTIPTWDSIDAGAKAAFTDDGAVWGIPTKNYSMGLVYNKNLFQQAGLDQLVQVEGGQAAQHADRRGRLVAADLAFLGGDVVVQLPPDRFPQHGDRRQVLLASLGVHGGHCKAYRHRFWKHRSSGRNLDPCLVRCRPLVRHRTAPCWRQRG